MMIEAFVLRMMGALRPHGVRWVRLVPAACPAMLGDPNATVRLAVGDLFRADEMVMDLRLQDVTEAYAEELAGRVLANVHLRRCTVHALHNN